MRQLDLVDALGGDLWVLGPEVPQVHPGLFPFVLDYPEYAEPRVRPRPPAARRGIRLPRARDPPLLESNDGVAGSYPAIVNTSLDCQCSETYT